MLLTFFKKFFIVLSRCNCDHTQFCIFKQFIWKRFCIFSVHCTRIKNRNMIIVIILDQITDTGCFLRQFCNPIQWDISLFQKFFKSVALIISPDTKHRLRTHSQSAQRIGNIHRTSSVKNLCIRLIRNQRRKSDFCRRINLNNVIHAHIAACQYICFHCLPPITYLHPAS